MTPDDVYRPPSSDEPAADTSRLSKDEWRYAAGSSEDGGR